jgi:signal transduction histidine kinase
MGWRTAWFRQLWLAAIFFFAVLGSAAGQPKRVLLLHSFGPNFVPWTFFSGQFREELSRQSPNPIDLYETSLDSARFAQIEEQRPIVDYLLNLFAERKLDLIVTVGAPAARFVQRYRGQFFPSTPMVISAQEQRVINKDALTGNDAVVSVALDFPKWIEHILQVLPNTSHIAWAVGASPLERSWTEEFRRASQPFENRVTFEWFNDLAFEDMLKRVATLPPNSAIFYVDLRVDAAGVPLDHELVLERLRERTKAPIFSYVDSFLGRGIVGGPLLSSQEVGRRMANAAVRILGGEAASNIQTPPLSVGTPVYDWRELQRWDISEARLPVNSIVRFRELAAWERYRWQLGVIFVVLLIQAAMITWLLIERRGRRAAELEARDRLMEVLHLNRTAEAGALSASFAHELSQPLGTIALNAETAVRLLKGPPSELGKLEELLADIQQANDHASEVMRHMRELLKRRRESDLEAFDLNEAISNALHVLVPEAKKRSISVSTNGIQQRLPVRGNRIHLQQVIINLATNGMDAMTDVAAGARKLDFHTALIGESSVEVSVSDSGTGIPNQKLSKIFETFYTTKDHGTGLGLSIARTIVEACGGKIWAENQVMGGAVFRFTLPLIDEGWSSPGGS